MSKEIVIAQTQIENRIFTVWGVQVILDRYLAEMYQVETLVYSRLDKNLSVYTSINTISYSSEMNR